MARIHEETIIVKISKLVKDDSEDIILAEGDELTSAIEAITTELLGTGFIIEVSNA
jgi:hypothetical protein